MDDGGFGEACSDALNDIGGSIKVPAYEVSLDRSSSIKVEEKITPRGQSPNRISHRDRNFEIHISSAT